MHKIKVSEMVRTKPKAIIECIKAGAEGKQYGFVDAFAANPAFVAAKLIGIKPGKKICTGPDDETGEVLAFAKQPMEFEEALNVVINGIEEFSALTNKPEIKKALWETSGDEITLNLIEGYEGRIGPDDVEGSTDLKAEIVAYRLDADEQDAEMMTVEEIVLWTRHFDDEVPTEMIQQVVFRKYLEFVNAAFSE